MLIPTKLHVPPSRPDLVERQRLLQWLDRTAGHRVTLISAPAGSGKTTLAVQWLGRSGARAAWLSLDALDSDPERFARYLVASLRAVLPAAMPGSLALLSARTPAPWSMVAEALVSELAGIEEPLVLVLDDYHALESDPIHQLMEGIVALLPEIMHLVVLTRVDPPWSLGRLRATGRLRELGGRNLLFSVEEAHALFARIEAPSLDDEAVALLHRRTEGWAAGLQLARLFLADCADPGERIRDFSGGQRLVADFLIEEVVAAQPPEVLEFLAVTSPLERFCAPLCDHLLADRRARGPSAAETIARLHRENLFLVEIDAGGFWYRYHHLFAEHLRHQDRIRMGRAAEQDLLRRAAEWFAGEGLVEESLRLFLAAGEVDQASELVGECLESVLAEDLSRRVLARWLALFPPGAERGRLPLLVAHGYLASIRGDLKGLAGLLGEAEQLLGRDGEGGSGLRAAVDAQRGFQLYWQGDAEAALAHAERALDTVPPLSGGMSWAMATMYQAASLARLGRTREANDALSRAAEEDASRGGRHAGDLLTARAGLGLYAGDLGASSRHARQMLAVHRTASLADYWLAHAHYFLGRIAYERDRLTEAEDHFRAVEPFRFLTFSRIYQDALIGRCLVARARGDSQEAEVHCAAALEFAVASGESLSVRIAESLETRLCQSGAGPLPGSTPPAWSTDVMSFWLEVPSLTWAEVAMQAGTAGSGPTPRGFVEEVLDAVEAAHNVPLAIALTLVRILAFDAEGRRDEALALLAAALERGEPLGLVRTFLDRGQRLQELLVALAERTGRRGYLAELLRAFEREALSPMRAGTPLRAATSPGGLGPRPAVAPEQLTERERDVLHLLALRLSNKEIAEQLSMGGETVKTHLRAIYAKLGVSSRREAVRHAQAGGLLSQSH